MAEPTHQSNSEGNDEVPLPSSIPREGGRPTNEWASDSTYSASASSASSASGSNERTERRARVSEHLNTNIVYTIASEEPAPPGQANEQRQSTNTYTPTIHQRQISDKKACNPINSVAAKSFLQQSPSNAELGQYEDELPAEDVGFSFCIRAPADFGGHRKWSNRQRDQKHLYGLDKMFPMKVDEELSQDADDKSVLKSCQFGVLPQEGRIADGADFISGKLSTLRMPYSAISSMSSRVHFALSTSAVISSLYVIGYCAVQPACSYGGSSFIVWAHLISSVIYGLVAIPSRGLFSRIDWRIGEELNSPAEVLAVDLRSPGLYFDVIALGGLIAEIAHLAETYTASPLPTPLQWLMLLQLVKIWRVVLPEETAENPRNFFQGIMKLMFSLLVFSHITGCAFLLVGHLEMSQGSESWLDKHLYDGVDMNHCVVRYTEAFYFAVIGLTSVGYGDLMVTSLEHNVNSFFLLVSQLFAAKICAELTWLTSMYNQNESDVHERRRSLVLALDKMGAPKVLVRRVLAFQVYENTFHADNMENETFRGLSKNLTAELRLCTYRKLVIQAPFLRVQPTEVISIIVNALSDSVYLPSDFIVRAGEPGRELFFVRRGEARAFLGLSAPVWGVSEAVAVMKTGSYFGELAMLTGFPRGSYVMATAYCICSILPYSCVEDLVDMHPEAFTTLVQTMVRMYKLKPKETWHDLTAKLINTVGIDNDADAFDWFRSHSDFPEVEDLCAKAFDLALMRLKVSHLDRRIFWSELDRKCVGGIDYKDFRGKLQFREKLDFADYEVSNIGEKICDGDPGESWDDSQDERRNPPLLSTPGSSVSCYSLSLGAPMLTCHSDHFIPELPAILPGAVPSSSSQSVHSSLRTDGNQATTSDDVTLKTLALLLEQNTRLLSEIQKLDLTA